MKVSPNVSPCVFSSRLIPFISYRRDQRQVNECLGKQCSGEPNQNAFPSARVWVTSASFSLEATATVRERTHKAGFHVGLTLFT